LDNDPGPNTGTSSNDPILNSSTNSNGLPSEVGTDTRITSLDEEQLIDNQTQTGANSTAQIGTDNSVTFREPEPHNSLQSEGAKNPYLSEGGGAPNPLPNGGDDNDNLPQRGGNNAAQEGGNNVVRGSSSSSGSDRVSSNPISVPERVDTSDPSTRHLTRGVPEEPSVLDGIRGSVDKNKSQTENVDENTINRSEEAEQSGNGNSSDLNEEVESNGEVSESSSNDNG
jgi:hypothetical protein